MEYEFQEDLLESESLDENDTSSIENDSLEEKLDHVEALLNENISLLEREENENIERIQEIDEQGTNNGIVNTVSGNNVSDPDYSQYIYDFLTDSQVKVETVQNEENIFNKSLNNYTVSESLMVIIILILLSKYMGEFIEKYCFKRR